MGCDPHVVRAEPAVKPQPTLLLRDLTSAVEQTLVRQLARLGVLLLLLQTGLDEIERQRQETGEEAGDTGGGKGLVLRGQAGVLLQLALGFGEEGQLAEVEGHGADDGGEGAGPEGADALTLGDAEQGVDDGAVVGALLRSLEAVGLHADEGQVGGVSDHGCNTTCHQTGASALAEGHLAVGVVSALGQGFAEGVEEAQTRGGVDGLAQETRGQAGVEIADLPGGNDIASDAERTRFGARPGALTGQLQADLDHVDGLDDGGSRHASQTPVRKGKNGTSVGVMEEIHRRRRIFCDGS